MYPATAIGTVDSNLLSSAGSLTMPLATKPHSNDFHNSMVPNSNNHHSNHNVMVPPQMVTSIFDPIIPNHNTPPISNKRK